MTKRVRISTLEGFVKFALTDIDFIEFSGHTWRKSTANVCKLNTRHEQWRLTSATADKNDLVDILFVQNVAIEAVATIAWYGKHELILNHKNYVMFKLHIKSLRKSVLIPALLKVYKRSYTENTPNNLIALINASRQAGCKYPEFDAIEKSILSPSTPKFEVPHFEYLDDDPLFNLEIE